MTNKDMIEKISNYLFPAGGGVAGPFIINLHITWAVALDTVIKAAIGATVGIIIKLLIEFLRKEFKKLKEKRKLKKAKNS